jgi:hypothetical protein
VQPEPPGGRVAAAREDVAPVLGDQPDAGGGGKQAGQRVVVEAERDPEREQEDDQEAEVPFVPAQAEEVDPRAERVPLDTQAKPSAPADGAALARRRVCRLHRLAAFSTRPRHRIALSDAPGGEEVRGLR